MKALVVSEITEAGKKGVRLYKACVYLDISVRTFERWRAGDYSDKRKGAPKSVSKKLSLQERQTIIDTACEARFRDCNPYEIIAILAGEGKYIGSESSVYRVLKSAGKLVHRSESKRGKRTEPPSELMATGVDQVWSWDITYLKTAVLGIYLFAYVIIDIWSRKIVGWAIHEQESADLAKELFQSIAARTHVRGIRLRSDNGSPMKGMTMIETLYRLGIVPTFSRPRVSDDNPFIESWFKTLKFTVGYPKYFDDLDHARRWMSDFVHWYNTEHLHSGIGYVTPQQRHEGSDRPVFQVRNETISTAYLLHPERWSRHIRIWGAPPTVALNAGRQRRKNVA